MIVKNWSQLLRWHALRLVWVLILVGLVIFFLYMKIVPSGQITYFSSWPRGLSSGQGFIYDFKPGERLDISNSDKLVMIGDPLYFSLFTPRSFDQAEVTVRYKDNLSAATPTIELGVLKDKLTGAYDLKPLENRLLDWLSQDWFELRAKDLSGEPVLLLQADNNYASIDEFWVDLERGQLKSCFSGPSSCLAVYNYSWSEPYRPPASLSILPLEIKQPFRGAHQFYVYLPAGPWNFTFKMVDLNLDPEPDPVTITISDSQGETLSRDLPDNNIYPVSGQEESKEINIEGLATVADLYKVQIKVSDDIVVSSLSSPSDKLAFINKFWPVSGLGDLALYTDSSYLQIKTFNPASLGKVIFSGQEFLIDETYRQFNLLRTENSNKIILSHDDVILETNGVFSFSENTLLNPNPIKFDRFFIPSPKISYVISHYQPPISQGSNKEATAILNLSGAYRESGRYQLLLSVPGLGAETAGNWLEIESITVKLQGKTLGQKIKSWIRK